MSTALPPEQSPYPPQVPYSAPMSSMYGSAPNGVPYAQYPPKPNNHLAMAIVAAFFFWPLAIFAIVKANEVDTLWVTGRQFEAEAAAHSAKTSAIWCYVIGVVIIALVIAFYVWLFVSINNETNGDYLPYLLYL